MKYDIYSVRDIHSGFGGFFPESNDFTAKRHFATFFQQGQLASFPQDYDLYCLASVEVSSGVVTPCMPRLVCTGVEAKAMLGG